MFVRDEDHAQAARPQKIDVLQHGRGLVDAERRRRLVEDEYPSAEMHRSRNRQTLPLSSRQCPHRLVRVTYVDADPCHFLARCPHGAAVCRRDEVDQTI